MRELFEEGAGKSPLDANDSARDGARTLLRKRFYKEAGVGVVEGGHAILLDGRGVRTPAKRALTAPHKALAESLAAEWEAQRDVIDPSQMPLTRLANSIIDGVTDRAAEAMVNLREATELYLEEFPMEATSPALLTTFEVVHA